VILVAATAVTAETATTMAFLIELPSFDSPASGNSWFDVETDPELPEPSRRRVPARARRTTVTPTP